MEIREREKPNSRSKKTSCPLNWVTREIVFTKIGSCSKKPNQDVRYKLNFMYIALKMPKPSKWRHPIDNWTHRFGAKKKDLVQRLIISIYMAIKIKGVKEIVQGYYLS